MAAPVARRAAQQVATETEADQPPEDFTCPITQDLMNDPVIVADGHTYERTAIERWLQTNTMSPKSGTELECKMLFPNHSMRGQIREWQEAQRLRVPSPVSSAITAGRGGRDIPKARPQAEQRAEPCVSSI